MCAGDALRCLHGETVGADRQPLEDLLLLGREELVTPANGGVHRTQALRLVSWSAGQQRSRRPRRASKSAGVSRLARAAASSIANGRPSRRQQISATTGALAS